ncbi:MAG: sorbosone dehydrogenase family protein [Flavobacteriaceae bacterium]
MRNTLNKSLILLLLLGLSCNTGDDTAAGDDAVIMTDDSVGGTSLELVQAFPQLSFSRPVDLQAPSDGTNRIFVVEQKGVINTFSNEPDVRSATVFLDIENMVFDDASEMGLLGLAFHPNFSSNGYFYVYYNPSATASRISRFEVSAGNSNMASVSSEEIILEFSQPFTNHNGGQLAFGPDGFLYISSGDGGDGGDPFENAQDLGTLLGAILRIDVNNTEGGLNYAIPSDNPFVNQAGARDEIFAYGLRNPWRMSFDTTTGLLWTADVGQGRWEEIDVIENGNNYGWDILEANQCFGVNGCDDTNLTPPWFEYNHDNDDKSVTGGYVYRGSEVTQLEGKYIYGDYISGRIWALSTDLNASPQNELLEDTNLRIVSFGTDENNELYICAFDGAIYKFQEL